jgi:hypothetical protein
MNRNQYIDRLIDSRNLTLWEDLNSKFSISIIETTNKFESCYSINKDVQIFINPITSSAASFTHELLHIWLRDLDVFIGASFTITLKSNEKLRRIFSDKLIDQMGDWFDHVKIFPKYLELGFEQELFLSDNNLNKFTEEEANAIKLSYSFLGIINAKSVDLYIGKFFSAKADISSEHEYLNQFQILNNLDGNLYCALEQVWNKWLEVDIFSTDIFKPSYHDVTFLLSDVLEKWIEGKRIS